MDTPALSENYAEIGAFLREQHDLMVANDGVGLRAQIDQEIAAAREAGLNEAQAALVTMLAMLVCGSDKVTLASFAYNLTPATVVASVLFGAFA